MTREGGLPHPSSTLSFQIPIGWSQYRSPSLLHYKATLSLSRGHSPYKCLHTLFSRAAALAPPSSKCSPRPSLRGYPDILLSTLPCLSKHRSTLPSSCDICQKKHMTSMWKYGLRRKDTIPASERKLQLQVKKKLFKRSTGKFSHLPVTAAQSVIQAKIYRAFCPT